MNSIIKMKIRLGASTGADLLAAVAVRDLVVKGRDAFALDALLQAGERGVTPIERPAPRWSHYIFKLRRAGLVIETIDEAHAGAYAGHHARYVLRSPIDVIEVERTA